MTKPRVKEKLYAQDSAMLDPLHCGSNISYVIAAKRRFWAELYLTDCNRKIQWDFNDEKESITKIDKAIEMLQNFRRQLIATVNSRKRVTRKPIKKPAQTTIPVTPRRGQKYLVKEPAA